MPYTCPVCGYPDLADRPRSPESGGSYEICPSCGYQFGHTDELLEIDDATWRRDWIGAGMPWRSVNPPPASWDPRAQLSNIDIPAPGDPNPARPDPRDGSGEDPGRSGERGQGVVEYLGVLVLVALIIVTVSTAVSAIPLERAVRSTLASVFSGKSSGGSGPTSGHGGGAGGSGGGSGGVVPPGGGTPGTGTGGSGTGSGTGGSGTGSANPAAAAVAAAAAKAQQTAENGGNGWGNQGTLADHFGRHGAGVGAGSQQQYTEQAQTLLQRAVDDHLPTKVDGDGVIRVWDPQTNEFGAYNPDGTTRTYFNSSLNSNGNSSAARAERYWDNQPGEDPWSGESGGSGGSGGSGESGGSGGSGGSGSSGGGGEPGGGDPGGGDPGGGDPVPIDPDPIPIDPIPVDPIPIVPLSVAAF